MGLSRLNTCVLTRFTGRVEREESTTVIHVWWPFFGGVSPSFFLGVGPVTRYDEEWACWLLLVLGVSMSSFAVAVGAPRFLGRKAQDLAFVLAGDDEFCLLVRHAPL